MDFLLIAVTVVSLAIAAAMSLVVLKLLREDRRRSEARIAALLETTGARRAAHEAAPYRNAPAAPRKAAPSPGPGGRAGLYAPPHSQKPARPRVGDLPLRASADLFVEPQRPPSWGSHIVIAAAATAVLFAAGFTLLGPADGPASVSRPGAAAPPAAAPLELLTLRHTAGASSLTVTGVVQNPRGGAALRRVTAAVYALDAKGEVIATNQAPVDLTTFGPGEESPFVVTVPVRGPVARYRVGFRTDAGDVIAHVDRRSAGESLATR
jgi:hypothetical protein